MLSAPGLSTSSSLALQILYQELITCPSSSRSFSQGIFPGAQALLPSVSEGLLWALECLELPGSG